ncbi:methyltransferase domain-containing protein [Alphaproteobacteria bacterium HT1-32]|nr:methyltransferase domain-containing protein [Alphaproteobacteria bacterium HT1-32]
MATRETFFARENDDAELENLNSVFWQSIVSHIDDDYGTGTNIGTIVDIGCHRGGFLYRAAMHWQCDHVFGIEPLVVPRQMAVSRLEAAGIPATVLHPEFWNVIPKHSADIITCQEVLYLIEDLDELFGHIARVLRPRRRAYFTLGCHTENPLWPDWRSRLINMGQRVFDHAPLYIMQRAEAAGMRTAVRPLRRDGWIIHSPSTTTFPVPSIHTLCEHQYRHKLLFRFDAPK